MYVRHVALLLLYTDCYYSIHRVDGWASATRTSAAVAGRSSRLPGTWYLVYIMPELAILVCAARRQQQCIVIIGDTHTTAAFDLPGLTTVTAAVRILQVLRRGWSRSAFLSTPAKQHPGSPKRPPCWLFFLEKSSPIATRYEINSVPASGTTYNVDGEGEDEKQQKTANSTRYRSPKKKRHDASPTTLL